MTHVPAQQLALLEPHARTNGLTVVGLFAGIGGIELGLRRAGHRASLMCEIDPAARAVLDERFADVASVGDVTDLDALPPDTQLVTAGFPCQDLSQAGRTAGITGDRSGLVGHVFRLLNRARAAGHEPRWLLLENVPFMLQLERGAAMRFLTEQLDRLGYRWAYRVVDTRAFGLPQRRRRVVLLASATDDPRRVLFSDDAGEPEAPDLEGRACGFYWTEGVRGLGFAIDAIPTLKGGSAVGIPSAPAIWMPDGRFVTPDLRDAERLQGFEPNWTAPAQPVGSNRNGPRWKLVGNAVSVPVAEWLGERLVQDTLYPRLDERELSSSDRWPDAAYGYGGSAWAVDRSAWPRRVPTPPLADFLQFEPVPLSARATAGFLRRAERGRLRFPAGFLEDLRKHLVRMNDD